MSINKVAQETAFGALGGLIIGTSIDSLFSEVTEANESNALKLLGETALQLGLTGLASAAYFEFLFRRGYREESTSKGVPFLLTVMGSQPNLTTKIGSLARVFGQKLGSAFDPAPIQISSKQPTFLASNISPLNPDNAGMGKLPLDYVPAIPL